MHKRSLKIYLALFLFAALTAFNPTGQAKAMAAGLIAEHVKSLNTLALSFVDISQPLYAIKLQILKEFLAHAENPKLLLLVSDDRDIKNTNAFIRQARPAFRLQDIRYVKAESSFLSSSWMRDFSPVMIHKKDGAESLVIFEYINESDYAVDQQSLAAAFKLPVKKVKLRLEGGNMLSDEGGRLFITTAVIENNLPADASAEQFELKKAEIEKLLRLQLAASDVVWVPRVPREFEGTGHVDMYLRLLKNKQAVVAESSRSVINNVLNEIAKIVAGKGYKVTRVKANPKITNKFRNQNIFASYTNSILVGKSIFIPKYGVPEDRLAVAAYEKLGYKVLPIDGESIHFGGSVHCLTYLYP